MSLLCSFESLDLLKSKAKRKTPTDADSRRQYISQMERWGIQKYNKPGLGGPKAEAHTIRNTPSSIRREHKQNQNGKSDQPQTPPYPKRNASDFRPDVPPKKRQKLSNFISGKAYEDLALAFDRMSSSEDGCQDLDPVSQNDTPSSQTFPASYTQKSDVLPTQNMSVQDVDALSDVSSEDDLLSTREKSDNLEVDMPDVLLDFDLDHFDDVKTAADFSFVSNCRADAFGMYVFILQRLELLKETPDLHEKMMIAAIIGCGRCARTPSQIEITVNVLNQILSQRPIYSEDTAEIFLYRCLLEDLYRKQGNVTEADFQQRLAARSTFVQNKCLSPPTPGN